MFLPDRQSLRVYLHRAPVDMRKQRHGLAAIAKNVMEQDLCSPGALFCFIGRGRDKIKVLYWDRNGFAVWYKEIEGTEKFHWPKRLDAPSIACGCSESNKSNH
jgi:transposase